MPIIVGISGSSGSGKTSLCYQIKDSLVFKSCAIISLDNFYKGITDGTDPKDYNFDHPNAFDIDQCVQTMKELKTGKPVQIPIYDFVTHKRKTETKSVNYADVILFEGIFALYWPELRALMDIKIFISTDMDHCLIRRMQRDTQERGRTFQQVIEQYLKFVKPAYKEFIRDTREYANIILPNNQDFSIGMQCIVQRLQCKETLNAFSEGSVPVPPLIHK